MFLRDFFKPLKIFLLQQNRNDNNVPKREMTVYLSPLGT
jgi:hypothetical protein